MVCDIIIVQVVSGGVASNKYVRARLDRVVKNNSLLLVCPPPSLCTDNGKLYFTSQTVPSLFSLSGVKVFRFYL